MEYRRCWRVKVGTTNC